MTPPHLSPLRVKCTSEIFQLTNRFRYRFVGKVMIDILSTKEIIQCASLRIPKGMKRKQFPISIAFSADILIRNDNKILEEHKVLKIGRVVKKRIITYTLFLCHIYHFKTFFVLFLRIIFLFLIKV